MHLTIAVICKNEEKNIERCLDSVFESLQQGFDPEIIVVDSFSTDRTIEIASKYPLKIIRLGENWPHSAAAGRYTAFRHATGKYTLVLDADMELISVFLGPAIEHMEKYPRTAAVAGIIEHKIYYDNSRNVTNITRRELLPVHPDDWSDKRAGMIKSVPGAGLFRTEAVLRAGNFHPYLRAEEEYELCQRLRAIDYELWYLPLFIAKHYGYLNVRSKELLRRLKRGHMLGTGDMLKWSMSQGFIKENILRLKVYLLIAVYFCTFPISLIMGIYYLMLWALGLGAILAIFVIKNRNLSSGILDFAYKAFMAVGILVKLPLKVEQPDTYPIDATIIDLRNPGT